MAPGGSTSQTGSLVVGESTHSSKKSDDGGYVQEMTIFSNKSRYQCCQLYCNRPVRYEKFYTCIKHPFLIKYKFFSVSIVQFYTYIELIYLICVTFGLKVI
jgi:hypothetical protein